MLKFNNVSKIFPNHNGPPVEVFKGLSLSVGKNEFVAFVGPSGCGKTTLLRLIAGLDHPTKGKITLNDKEIKTAGPERGMVFQDLSLFPWLTVFENIAFGLRVRGLKEQDIKHTVAHYLKIIGLEQFRNSYPNILSGGMSQRVAIARTLANNPEILLMDEPFGSLDTQTRSQMQEFLAALWEREKKTVVFVTHDIEEAIFLSDRVCILSSQPCEIKKEIKIDFPRPRVHELKFSEEFFTLKKIISELM